MVVEAEQITVIIHPIEPTSKRFLHKIDQTISSMEKRLLHLKENSYPPIYCITAFYFREYKYVRTKVHR